MSKLDLEAIETLWGILAPGDHVYTVLKKVAPNGMSRHITVLVGTPNGGIRNITNLVGRAAGYRVSDKTGALVVGGTGMDMGFSVVYSLSRTLFPTFECTGKPGCPANDHTNDYGDHARSWNADCETVGRNRTESNAATYDTMRREYLDKASARDYSQARVHSDGGYALRQSWL